MTRPRPAAPPVYRDGPSKMSEVDARSWNIDDVLDAVFFAIAATTTLWLVWLSVDSGWHLDAVLTVNSLLFWMALAHLALPRLHQALTWLYVLDYFIGRTHTLDGSLGDPINLAVKGDEENTHEATITVGWVRAGSIALHTSWRIIVSSPLRRSYPATPIFNLMFFGRKQSSAYQKEVEGNPVQRHHIRSWYCPQGWLLSDGGYVDWLAAATYDCAVSLSALTLQVTHKIDADVDTERNYVVDDVCWANEAAESEIWPDVFTSFHDENGGGDRVVTDGAFHVFNLNEVVPGSDAGLSPQLARLADHQARRRRPNQLVTALMLIGLMMAVETLRVARIDITQVLEAVLSPEEDPGAVTVVVALIAMVSGGLMLITTALGVTAWRGHPCGRIALMATLVLGIATDMVQVSSLGVHQATLGLVITSALQVLVLLAFSIRQAHQWEHARKGEWLADCMGAWGDRAAVRLGS